MFYFPKRVVKPVVNVDTTVADGGLGVTNVHEIIRKTLAAAAEPVVEVTEAAPIQPAELWVTLLSLILKGQQVRSKAVH
jgi:hypothetical protein